MFSSKQLVKQMLVWINNGIKKILGYTSNVINTSDHVVKLTVTIFQKGQIHLLKAAFWLAHR
jgi:hypothetical protein